VIVGLVVALLVALLVGERVWESRQLRLERERHERDVKALERELQIGLPLDVRLGRDPTEAYIASLPEPTPLGLHIDCLLRMGVITFAEWLVLADEHTPLTFTSEPRFDPPSTDAIAEADQARRER
jgi:hypothetical protein